MNRESICFQCGKYNHVPFTFFECEKKVGKRADSAADQNVRRDSTQIYRKTTLHAWCVLTVELFLHLFLDDTPSIFGVRHDALRAVLHAGRQGGIGARAVEEEEGAVAEQAGMPVFELVTRQKFTFKVYEVFIIHMVIVSSFLFADIPHIHQLLCFLSQTLM